MWLLVNLQTWLFRVLFSLIIILSGAVIILQFVDFSKVDMYITPLYLLKKKPERIKGNIWVGGFFVDRDFVDFLKSKNISTVISLLDKDMKHERDLLRYERAFFKRFGIKVISVPLKPFVYDPRSLRKLKQLLNGRGNVYIHSYFGRIRIKQVRRLILGGKGH